MVVSGLSSASLGRQALVVLLVLLGLTAMAWLAGRILGVRRGFLRAAAAALIGFAVGGLVWQTTAVTDANAEAERIGLLGYLVVVLLATMLTSIVIDVVYHPPNERSSGIPHPIRAFRQRLQIASRIWTVTRIARRNGLIGPRAAASALTTQVGARRLRLTIEASGGMLVKFGQIASTREDLLTPEVIGELSGLRMNLPPLAVEQVRATIEAELGAPIEQVFADFDPEPLAAASVGVTHRAVLPDGRRVIVKVRRPDVEQRLAEDAAVIQWATRIAATHSARLRRLGILDLVDELIEGVTEELDFTRELANNAAMRLARGDDPGIYLPAILPELTTAALLVMDEVDGVAACENAAQQAATTTGHSREQLADSLFQSFMKQVLRDGLFHADPHPGNVLICRDGRIALIDYGAVGRIDPVTQEALQLMAAGFQTRDASLLARAVRRMVGNRSDGVDIASLELDLALVLSDYGSGGFDPGALQEIFEVLSRHGIAIPRALTVLGRAALTLEGTLRRIDPNFRMAQRASKQLGGLLPVAGHDPRALITQELARALPALRNLPQLSEDIALQARAGQLRLNVERFSGADGARVQEWVDQVVFAALSCLGMLGSVALLAIAGLTTPPASSYLFLIGAVALVITLAMQLRVAAGIVNRQMARSRKR